MKKIILFLTFFLVLGAISCTKDNESIAGTTWIGADGGSAMRVTFTQTDFELKEINRNDAVYGTYAYHKPDVTFIVTKRIDSAGKTYTGAMSMKGTVSGNQLSITLDSGSTAYFTRQ